MVGEYRGHEGFRRAWAAWLEAFKDLRIEPVAAEQHGFTLYTFRSGRVFRHEFFIDQEVAETAAGLR